MKHRAMFHGSPWPGEDHLRRTETSFTMSPGMPRQWRQKSPGSRYTSCIDINIQILYWLWILGYTMIYYPFSIHTIDIASISAKTLLVLGSI